VAGVLGMHRSADEGLTWTRVNDDAHEYGGLANGQFVAGDMNVFGRVYMSTAGRGIVYGESNDTCLPAMVIPNIQVNAETKEQTAIIYVEQADNVLLSPEPASDGTWSWQGPNDFTSSDREVELNNIQFDQSGIYFVQHTNPSACTSAWQTFVVNVSSYVTSVTVSGTGNSITIDQKDGTLQMLATILPDNASDKSVTWSITSGNSSATISTDGLLTATAEGVATVRATANDGTEIFDEIEITIANQTITGIEDNVLRYEIYPNPFYTSLNINNAKTIKEVNFINAHGQVVKRIIPSNSLLTINLEDLSAGLYILQLRDDRNKSYLKKLVKK
jgi:uncharacterized protein YjdB